MGLYCDSARNVALDAMGTAIDVFSLHTLWPGCTGANEVIGGAPVYTREAAAWNPSGGGVKSQSGSAVFNVPPGEFRFVGLRDDLVAGSYYGSVPLGATKAFAFC